MSDLEMADDEFTMADFVLYKGALSVLFELGIEDKSFNELKDSETVLISPNTISKRLKEAQRLGLIQKIVGEGQYRSTIDYTLTDTGESFLAQFENVHEDYFDLKNEISELKQQIHNKEQQIQKLLSEEAGRQLEDMNDTSGEEPEEEQGSSPEQSGSSQDEVGTEEDTTEATVEEGTGEETSDSTDEESDEVSQEEDEEPVQSGGQADPPEEEPEDEAVPDEEETSEEGDEEIEKKKEEIEQLRQELEL